MSKVKEPIGIRINKCIGAMSFMSEDAYDIDNGIEETEREMVESIVDGFKHRVIDVDYFHSGGGCMHLMFMLDSHHIITFHNASEQVEISYNKWESFDDYYDAEERTHSGEVDYEIGMGWEHIQPNSEMRGMNLDILYKNDKFYGSGKTRIFDIIEKNCSKLFFEVESNIKENKEFWEQEAEYVTSNIVNDWFANFEDSNKGLTDEYNEACDGLRTWTDKSAKLEKVLKAKQECEVGFQDCIEYSDPIIREAFKSRGFEDGTWRNSISPSFELWLDTESPISNDVLFIVYFPNLTEEDNPSDLDSEQFNHYSIELMVNGDNILDDEDWLCFDNYDEVLGFFYSNTKIGGYTLAIDKEVK